MIYDMRIIKIIIKKNFYYRINFFYFYYYIELYNKLN